jgi:hypothetical protein
LQLPDFAVKLCIGWAFSFCAVAHEGKGQDPQVNSNTLIFSTDIDWFYINHKTKKIAVGTVFN